MICVLSCHCTGDGHGTYTKEDVDVSDGYALFAVLLFSGNDENRNDASNCRVSSLLQPLTYYYHSH